MKRNVLILLLLYALFPGMLFGQMATDSCFLKIASNMMTQLHVYPQEKIHVHTDRDRYVSGEKIWFKVYLTDALTHQTSTSSRYVYVELISPADSLVGRVMIRSTVDGLFYGHLPLTEIIPEGNYTLRAYTRYMENTGDDYFFRKNIRIGKLTSVNNQPDAVRKRRKEPPVTNDFDVSFYPEGGYLVEGVLCKVAFKALNRRGHAETISGEITDDQGTVVTNVHTFHAGMGVFSYIPEAGKRYLLKCRNDNGLEKQFEMPQPNPRTCALTVSQRNQRLTVGILTSVHSRDMPRYLLAHCRGNVFHFSALDNDHAIIAFPQEALPTGIIQLIVFDRHMNPLSERLVFNKNDNVRVKVTFRTDKAHYRKRDKVVSTLSSIDSEGYLSVSVTDDQDGAIDSSVTLLSTLLLSSELKGYIEEPAYYLQDTPASVIALDYLMMTHGWRRYTIPEAVKGNPELPHIPYQTSQRISGRVKSLWRTNPVPDSEIVMMTENEDIILTSTDGNGEFLFDEFEYPDSTSYFIQALSKKGSSRVELVMDRESFPKLTYAYQRPIMAASAGEGTECEAEPDAFIEKAEQRSKYDEDMRVIYLSEVEVMAPRIVHKDEPRLQYWANRDADATIRKEDVEKTGPRLVVDWLRNFGVAGVTVLPNGRVSIRGGGRPLVLIDGIPQDWPENMMGPEDSPLETVSASDVESIDIFKGVSTSLFGVRGANGVISITTRRGVEDTGSESEGANYAVYSPLGYQQPIAFYAPKYETPEAKLQSVPDYRTTIFWKPDVKISDTKETEFEFYTSDFPTTYSVVIEGLTTDGKIIRQIEKIRVE